MFSTSVVLFHEILLTQRLRVPEALFLLEAGYFLP